jgi:hypothetical protein
MSLSSKQVIAKLHNLNLCMYVDTERRADEKWGNAIFNGLPRQSPTLYKVDFNQTDFCTSYNLLYDPLCMLIQIETQVCIFPVMIIS